MQYSLKSGDSERRNVIFNQNEVRQYCKIIGRIYDGTVPPLMCAQLWPEFEMFQVFIGERIKLARTEVKKYENLESDIQYCAYLTHKSFNKVKQFDQYIFELKINKNYKTCMIIEQLFIGEGNANEV